MNNTIEDAIKSLSELGVQIQKSEEEHRANFIKLESKESNASRMLVDGLISSIYLKVNEPISGITPEGEYQLLLGASFIRTHLLLNDVILNGHISEGHCLLRRQLEQLARLEELESNTVEKLKKKTPNIKFAGKGAGPIYGAQSEVAHFSHPDVGYSLLEVHNGDNHARVTVFQKYSTNSHYAMNSRLFIGVQFGAWFISRLKKWYPNKDFELLDKQLEIAVQSMICAGIITTIDGK